MVRHLKCLERIERPFATQCSVRRSVGIGAVQFQQTTQNEAKNQQQSSSDCGMSYDLLFRGMEVEEQEKPQRQNCKNTKAHLKAMVLQTKPEGNKWLHLTFRIAALVMDLF